MSTCPIDHTQQDVVDKLAEQQLFMPESVVQSCELFLSQPLSQETLNVVFHLLKKYDLATEEERLERDGELRRLFV